MADSPNLPAPRPSPLGFTKKDLTDGRERYDWKRRYDKEATREIRFEAIYVGSVLALAVGFLIVIWCGRHGTSSCWLAHTCPVIGPDGNDTFTRYCFAWLGGMIGGILFTVKWLYHSVAKGSWHLERRLWRIFTPHISGALATMVVVLISSGIFPVLNARSVDSLKGTLGVSFLVGYFSDHAIAKLTELAETLFGRRMDVDAPDKASKNSIGSPPADASPSSTTGTTPS
jgi:hypothetical protein